jgi:hypothetical protein
MGFYLIKGKGMPVINSVQNVQNQRAMQIKREQQAQQEARTEELEARRGAEVERRQVEEQKVALRNIGNNGVDTTA